MIKYVFLILLLSSGDSFAQQEIELHSIMPKWSKDEKRIVQSNTQSITYIADTVFNNTKVKGTYVIEVIETSPAIRISIYQSKNDIEITATGTAGVNERVQAMMKKMTDALGNITFVFNFDQETGQVTELVNSEEVLNKMDEMIAITAEELIPEDKTEEQKQQMLAQMRVMMGGMKDQMVNTFVNAINQIFVPYQFNYPLNGEVYSETILTYDLNEINPAITKPVPAVLSISGAKNGNKVNVSSELVYDKENLLRQMNEARPTMELKPEQVSISDLTNFTIDSTTTWIESIATNTALEMDMDSKIKVEMTTDIRFSKP